MGSRAKNVPPRKAEENGSRGQLHRDFCDGQAWAVWWKPQSALSYDRVHYLCMMKHHTATTMPKAKVTVTIDATLLDQVDTLVS